MVPFSIIFVGEFCVTIYKFPFRVTFYFLERNDRKEFVI